MTSLQGKGASSGVAVGRLLRLAHGTGAAHPSAGEPEEELRRLEAAREAALRQLETVSERARRTLGADGAEIFEVHRMMLADRDFLDAVEGAIRDGASAEAAATAAGERFAALDRQE